METTLAIDRLGLRDLQGAYRWGDKCCEPQRINSCMRCGMGRRTICAWCCISRADRDLFWHGLLLLTNKALPLKRVFAQFLGFHRGFES